MLVLFIILATLSVFWKWYTRRQPNEPPELKGAWPFIGHGHYLIGGSRRLWDKIMKITDLCMELGHVAYFYAGPVKIYVLTDPDDISTVANTCLEKDEFYHKFSKGLLGEGLVYSSVPLWKKHRKLITPAFNQQILDSFMNVFNKQGRNLVNSLEVEVGKGSFDHTNYLKQNSMENICLTAIDDSITPEEAKVYVETLEVYNTCTINRFQTFWLHPDFIYRISNLGKKSKNIIQILLNLSEKVLMKKRAYRKLNGPEPNTEKSKKIKVFMDLLMDLDNGLLTDQEIRDELTTIIIAGHETSAIVLTTTLVLIGSHPEVQDKLYAESQRIFGNTDRDLEKQDFSQLTYMDAVIKESMRFYVLAPLLGRYIDREVKLKRWTLKPGNNCYFLTYGLHRHPSWGPDADEFKPERWLDPATLPKNPNTYAAFSFGKRNCIGQSYAMMSMKTTLTYLLRHYKLHADHTKMQFKFEGILIPMTGHHIAIDYRMKI